jgi:predicted dehydrogenase
MIENTPPTPPPIRLGLLGAGIFSREAHLPALLSLPDRFQVGALYSRTPASAEAAAALLPYPVQIYTQPEDIFNDPAIDAVDVVLPILELPGMVKAALAAGKHVISEKPLAATLAEGRAMLKAAQAHPHLAWVVAENWRYAPHIQHAAQIIQSGALGQLGMFHWAIYAGLKPQNKYYQTAWRRDGSYQGGFILDGGVHFAAALRDILGEVAEVTARARSLRPDLPPLDTLTATVEMQSGLTGTLAFCYAVGLPFSTSLTIVGERGVLEVNRDNLKLTLEGEVKEDYRGPSNGVREELQVFAALIREAGGGHQSAQKALGDLALIESLLRAADSRQAHRPHDLLME